MAIAIVNSVALKRDRSCENTAYTHMRNPLNILRERQNISIANDQKGIMGMRLIILLAGLAPSANPHAHSATPDTFA